MYKLDLKYYKKICIPFLIRARFLVELLFTNEGKNKKNTNILHTMANNVGVFRRAFLSIVL